MRADGSINSDGAELDAAAAKAKSDFNPRAFYKDVKSLKKLRKEGIYNNSEFEAKLQHLKIKHEAGSGSKVEQQAKKRKKSAAEFVKPSA